MVELDKVGLMITLVMLISGNFMAVIAVQDPTESFGMNPDLDATTMGKSDIELLVTQFNSDTNQIASPDLFNQIRFGGAAIVTGAILIFTVLISAFTNWLVVIDLIFAFTTDTTVLLLVLPIKALISFIMAFTIMTFLGTVVRSLPFFGGR